MTWNADGWPVINGGRPIELEIDAPLLPPWPQPAPAVRDDFEDGTLGLQWNFRRNPVPGSWSLAERPGWLRLWGAATDLDGASPLTFIGRRQQHFTCRVRTRIAFAPASPREEAGLTVLMNEGHHYELAITRREGRRVVCVRRRIGDLVADVAIAPLPEGPVVLAVDADPEVYRFSFGPDGNRLTPLASGQVRYLTTAVAGGYTGVTFGMYATGRGSPRRVPADLDWFDYEPLAE